MRDPKSYKKGDTKLLGSGVNKVERGSKSATKRSSEKRAGRGTTKSKADKQGGVQHPSGRIIRERGGVSKAEHRGTRKPGKKSGTDGNEECQPHKSG